MKKNLEEILAHEDELVLLDTIKEDRRNSQTMLFRQPIEIITAQTMEELLPAILRAEGATKAGYYVAGYISYEAGFAMDERLSSILQKPTNSNLLRLGIYEQAEKVVLNNLSCACEVTDITLDVSYPEYQLAIERIKDYIRSGDVYQVNYTLGCDFFLRGSALALYSMLRKRQRVSYAAFLRHSGRELLSLSPELFFRQHGRQIMVRPMKGTAGRGKTAAEDSAIAERLCTNEKERAENIMIVDLLRNDLGRICENSSVKVTQLCEVERYESLQQMTSTVEGRLRRGTGLLDIFRAMFPCGSVTGAPKLRSMEIINELELHGRGIYTGAIGYAAPKQKAVFNVAIRTIEISGNQGRMGIGSGVVWDSVAEKEYAECIAKAGFLTRPNPATDEEFMLLESILVRAGRCQRLSKHLARLRSSAGYFGFTYDEKGIRQALKKYSSTLSRGHAYKVRLLLSRTGELSLESQQIVSAEEGVEQRAAFAGVNTDSQDLFLYHKTTQRQLYERLFSIARKEGLFDVMFTNERGEVTEGCITNIFIKKGGQLFTPPVSCGLLNGIYRQYVIKKYGAAEKVLYRADIESADEVYLTNAIRGMQRVRLEPALQAD